MLSDWPLDRPGDWIEFVNEPQSASELEALRRSGNRGTPFGDEQWQKETAADLDLESALRPRGRPKKALPNG